MFNLSHETEHPCSTCIIFNIVNPENILKVITVW
jgi:hypothetical protein